MQTLSAQSSWSHNVKIIEKCNHKDWKDYLRREFYIKMSIKNNWSVRELENQLTFLAFEKQALQQNNFDLTIEEKHIELIQNTIKDSYIFDFLSLWDEYKERDLESNLLKNLKIFILELWIGFAYVWNQYNLKLEWDNYFLDMLFYHIKLKCYIVIELKIWKFLPEYAWKLSFYLNVIDWEIKEKNDNPTIWILICKDKSKKTVEYSLKTIENPLSVSEYNFNDLPDNFKENLPGEEKINTFLDKF